MRMTEIELLDYLNKAFPTKIIYADQYRLGIYLPIFADVRKYAKTAGHPYSGLQTRDLSGEKLDMLSQICASGTQMNYLQNVARLTLLTIYFANIH